MQEGGVAIRNALISASVNSGTHIYQNVAATGAPYPYIVISKQGGGDSNEDAVMLREEFWQVVAVGTVASSVNALGTSIMDTLHRQSITMPNARWGLVGIESNEQIIEEDERPKEHFVNDERVFIRGGIYRVRLYQCF